MEHVFRQREIQHETHHKTFYPAGPRLAASVLMTVGAKGPMVYFKAQCEGFIGTYC